MASTTLEFTKDHEHDGKLYGPGHRKAFKLGVASALVGLGVARDVGGKLNATPPKTAPAPVASEAEQRFQATSEVVEDEDDRELNESFEDDMDKED